VRARILVVEDNPLNLQLVRDILEHGGHEIYAATSVQAARKTLEEAKPDIVLLDIQLPGGGGEKLLREIRASAVLADLPVIAVTALAMEGDRERLLSAGFDGYLSKPIDTRTFAATVESFLEKKGASDVG
jgi:two-component system cell cycle response regulator DivK